MFPVLLTFVKQLFTFGETIFQTFYLNCFVIDQTIQFFKIFDDSFYNCFFPPQGWVWSLNYDAAQSRVVSSGWDYKIHTWDLSNDAITHTSSINCKAALLCADLNSDNLVITIDFNFVYFFLMTK